MNDIRKTIHAKVVDLARELGHDARNLRYNEEIAAQGLLDSPALLELVVWFEGEFGIAVDQDDLTIENFGTIDAMASYWERIHT